MLLSLEKRKGVLYWAGIYYFPSVAWIWGEKIAFSSLLQAGEHNFITIDSRNRWKVINPSPVSVRYCVAMLSEKFTTPPLNTISGSALMTKVSQKGQGRSNPMHISWTFSLSNFPSQNGRVVSQSYCLFVKMSRIERVKSTPHLAGYKSRSHKNWIIYLSPFNSQLPPSAWEWQFAQFTVVDFMVRSRFREYEEEKLRSPACCRQENATFSPHIHGTQSAP